MPVCCLKGLSALCYLQIIKFGKVVRPVMGISFAPDQSGGRGRGRSRDRGRGRAGQGRGMVGRGQGQAQLPFRGQGARPAWHVGGGKAACLALAERLLAMTVP